MFERILPPMANNEYRGSPLAFYGLCLFTAVFAFRSLVHFLKDDGGINSIASIITFHGTPDPDQVIHLLDLRFYEHEPSSDDRATLMFLSVATLLFVLNLHERKSVFRVRRSYGNC